MNLNELNLKIRILCNEIDIDIMSFINILCVNSYIIKRILDINIQKIK